MMKPKPTMQMSGKALYCLGQHFKVLCDDALKKKVGDVGKPCATCIYKNECFPADPNFWLKMQDQLWKATGLWTNLCVSDKTIRRDHERSD